MSEDNFQDRNIEQFKQDIQKQINSVRIEQEQLKERQKYTDEKIDKICSNLDKFLQDFHDLTYKFGENLALYNEKMRNQEIIYNNVNHQIEKIKIQYREEIEKIRKENDEKLKTIAVQTSDNSIFRNKVLAVAGAFVFITTVVISVVGWFLM